MAEVLATYDYTLNSDGVSYSITCNNTSTCSQAIIPSSYNGKPVTTIGFAAFYDCSGLTSVTIGNGVTSIGDMAFSSCYMLTRVNYTGTIDQWVQISFSGYGTNPLGNGGNLYINDNLVTEAVITTATNINDYAFYYCKSLTSITLGNSVTSIGDYAFSECKSLTSVTLGNSVTSIGEWAFEGCSLTNITISNSVTSIGEYAFYGCDKLVEVINKSNLNITKGSESNGYVGYYALNIKTSGTSDIVNKDGFLFYTYDNVNYLMGYIGSATELILPDNYKGQNYEIYKRALYCCYWLTSVTIPNSITSISDYAFYECSSLTSVTIGNSVTSIGNGAFDSCPLTSITIPDSVISIGNNAFNSCHSLTSVTIPDSVTSIGPDAFYECKSLTSVTIGNGVTSIGGYAFYNCRSLTSVTIGKGVISIIANAFYYCLSLESVTIKAITPPTLGTNVFNSTNNCPIYVPTQSVNAYKTALNWSAYASRIQAIPIIEIEVSTLSGWSLLSDGTYNIQVKAKREGYRDSDLSDGVNITK